MLDIVRLLTAIAAEVTGFWLLKCSDGMAKIGPLVGSLASYVVSLFLLSEVLKTMPAGPVYAVWGGVGTAATAFIGWYFGGDRLAFGSWLGITLVIAGVVLLGINAPPED